MQGDVGRCSEMWGDAGRCGEMQGDVRRCHLFHAHAAHLREGEHVQPAHDVEKQADAQPDLARGS